MAAATVMAKAKPKARSKKQAQSPLLETDRNYSVSDGAAAAGVSGITFWRAIYAGHLLTYRVGRRRVVSGQQIKDWLDAGGKTSAKGGE